MYKYLYMSSISWCSFTYIISFCLYDALWDKQNRFSLLGLKLFKTVQSIFCKLNKIWPSSQPEQHRNMHRPYCSGLQGNWSQSVLLFVQPCLLQGAPLIPQKGSKQHEGFALVKSHVQSAEASLPGPKATILLSSFLLHQTISWGGWSLLAVDTKVVSATLLDIAVET